MNREVKVDWKVEAIVDREFIVEEAIQLLSILERQRISCIVSAAEEDEAITEASKRLELHGDPMQIREESAPEDVEVGGLRWPLG
ncbi:hypothetical protein KEJ13_09090 [Candidatus Bathyarchaeota archaeon]|nr:hypothetical protein [Candidatus Bathyarchaeota archaeon]